MDSIEDKLMDLISIYIKLKLLIFLRFEIEQLEENRSSA
jgi:hypothetical protein